MNERFDLVFKGELVPGSDLAQTKKNIANLFKIGADKVEVLFSGKAVTLKKNLDADTANTYRVAIKKAGARVNLLESKTADAPVQSSTAAASTSPQATSDLQPAPSPQPNVSPQPTVSPKPSSAESKPETESRPETEEASSSTISIQAQGGNLVSREELGPEAVAPDIALDHLSLRDQQGNLVDGSEIHHAEAIEVDIPDVDISSLEEYLLKPEERSSEVEPEAKLADVDYSLAEPGATLAEAKVDNAQPPNTDHIQLADQ